MDLNELLAGFSDELEPIRALARRLAIDGHQELPNTVVVSHRPKIAPQAYALWLYAPLPPDRIAWYEQRFELVIPTPYKRVLSMLNGVRAFEFDLFGIPPSMASEPGLLDRSTLQPLDLGSANRNWKSDYRVDPSLFHFGGGAYSHEENIGYFLDVANVVYSCRKNGQLLRSWNSFRDFLNEELAWAEGYYPKFEAFMSELNEHLAAGKETKKKGRRKTKA